MGLCGFFRKNIKSTSNPKIINEASAIDIDTSFVPNRRSLLSSLFKEEKSGQRIPTAVKSDEAIPFWGDEYVSYPFVGIDGFSSTEAPRAQPGKQIGHLSKFLSDLSSNDELKSVYYEKVSQGISIPKDVFILYQDTAFSNVGNGHGKKSMNPLNPQSLSNAVRKSLGDFAYQQVLNVDENGNLFVDSNRNSDIVMLPQVVGTRHVTRQTDTYSALYVSKITEYDVRDMLMRSLDIHIEFSDSDEVRDQKLKKAIADMLTNAAKTSILKITSGAIAEKNVLPLEHFNPYNQNVVSLIQKKNPKYSTDAIANSIKNNPEAYIELFSKKFNEYVSDNNKTSIDFINDFVKDFYFPSVFDKTYCMKTRLEIANMKNADGSYKYTESDIKTAEVVYRACIEKKIDTNSQTENDNSVIQLPDDIIITKYGDAIMYVCRKRYSGEIKSTFAFGLTNSSTELRRDNDNEIVKEANITKRSFIRILYAMSSFGLDDEFLKMDDRNKNSGKFTLDYSPLFDNPPGRLIVSPSAKRRFNCMRIHAYIITYKYDSEIEKLVDPNEKDYDFELLKSYYSHEGGNRNADENETTSFRVDQPARLDLVYFADGDFISSSYSNHKGMKLVDMSETNVPVILKPDVLGVNNNRIKSDAWYGTKKYNLINRDNIDDMKPYVKLKSLKKKPNNPNTSDTLSDEDLKEVDIQQKKDINTNEL